MLPLNKEWFLPNQTIQQVAIQIIHAFFLPKVTHNSLHEFSNEAHWLGRIWKLQPNHTPILLHTDLATMQKKKRWNMFSSSDELKTHLKSLPLLITPLTNKLFFVGNMSNNNLHAKMRNFDGIFILQRWLRPSVNSDSITTTWKSYKTL